MTMPLGLNIPAELVAQSSGFVQSAAVFDRIADRVAVGAPFVVLVAAPGFGKTSIAVQLVQISCGTAPPTSGFAPGWLDAWHFCQARRYESLDPRAVLERLATQLCQSVPGYAEEIARSEGNATITITQTFGGDTTGSTVTGIGNLVLPVSSPRKLLHDFFRKPLAKLGRDVTILVDALNESDEQDEPTNSLAWLLATIQDDPIPQLRVLLTTQNGTTARRFSSGHLALRDIRSTGADDVHTYVLRRLQDAGVAEAASLATRITGAADGNFLYAVHAVSQHLVTPTSDALVLPTGLAQLYQEFISRRVAADIDLWHRSVRPTLALLVQSRGDGFSRELLATISGLAPSAVDEALERCFPYLLGEFDGPFVPHHEALREYLRTAPQHCIHPLEATRRIVQVLRRAVSDTHAVAHLLGYLADYYRLAEGEETAAAVSAIEETLTDPAYLYARLAATGVDSLVAEIAALRRAISGNEVLDTIYGVLTRQTHNLRQWNPVQRPALALQQILYDCAYSGVPDLIAPGTGEGRPALRVEWSARSEGTLLLSHTFADTEDGCQAMALSSDSHLVAFVCGRSNGRVHVYEVETGWSVRSFSFGGRISDICFSKDDQKVLVQREDGGVVGWNLTTGGELSTTSEEALPVQQKPQPILPFYIDRNAMRRDYESGPIAATTPDGRFAAAWCFQHGRQRQFIAVWDLRRREIIGVHFDGRVDALAITADGSKVIVGRVVGAPYVLSSPPRTRQTSPRGHSAAVQAVALRGHRALSIGSDGSMKLRDSRTGRSEFTVNGLPYAESAAITDDGRHCMVGNANGDIDIFDPELQLVVRKLTVEGIPVDELWRSRDGARETELPRWDSTNRTLQIGRLSSTSATNRQS